MIEIGRDKVCELSESASREWLETNGLGGFSSGTVSGINSRRYHGLLTVPSRPPLGRVVLLSKFEEILVVGDSRYELSANRYPGTVHPRGFEFLTSFRLDPYPVWTFEVDGLRVEKSVFMPQGVNAVVCRWRMIDGDDTATLELRPLVAFRDFHHLRTTDSRFEVRSQSSDTSVISAKDGEFPSLHLSHNTTDTSVTGSWYRNFEYTVESERGFDFRENLYQPLLMRFHLGDGATVAASTGEVDWRDAAALAAAEKERRAQLVENAEAADAFEEQLVLATDQFIVDRGDGKTVIAGYPWFSDWGRDTMIALPGLTLSTKRPEIAKDILREFSKHVSQGMIPNRFPDEGETPDYNTADATLWYFEAVRAYLEATGDTAFVKAELFETLTDIIAWHLKGTRHGIHADTDGLLIIGEPGVQLTWMDAKYGDEVFTPRNGKPVEIQALWYNALRIMEGLAEEFDDSSGSEKYRTTASLVKESFNGIFWNEDDQCLFDVVENKFQDRSIRPNQIFAVGLFHPVLDGRGHARKVVSRVERDLLTPFGLRSLTSTDPRYRGRYKGSPYERDSSYHQGPVWGWLIGPFIDAFARVFPERVGEIPILLSGFERHLYEAGIGQISEIFEGDEPHTPRGCPAQAWSVAEVLRVSKQYK